MTPADRQAAHYVVNMAINDEIDHKGEATMTETLACFLEYRVAELIAHIKGDGAVILPAPDELLH